MSQKKKNAIISAIHIKITYYEYYLQCITVFFNTRFLPKNPLFLVPNPHVIMHAPADLSRTLVGKNLLKPK